MFELYDGFIQKVEQQDSVPEGYIGIYTFDDFKKIAEHCPGDSPITSMSLPLNEFNTANYILMNDIVCPNEYDSAALYSGVIDGNGYTISNVSKPLFIYTMDATIKNLGIEVNYSVNHQDDTFRYGAIASADTTSNIMDKTSTVIENCFVKGSIEFSCRSSSSGAFVGKAAEETVFLHKVIKFSFWFIRVRMVIYNTEKRKK